MLERSTRSLKITLAVFSFSALLSQFTLYTDEWFLVGFERLLTYDSILHIFGDMSRDMGYVFEEFLKLVTISRGLGELSTLYLVSYV